MMSSKQRILWAIAFYSDNNRDEAQALLQQMRANRLNYLMQGEVASDLAIIEHLTA